MMFCLEKDMRTLTYNFKVPKECMSMWVRDAHAVSREFGTDFDHELAEIIARNLVGCLSNKEKAGGI